MPFVHQPTLVMLIPRLLSYIRPTMAARSALLGSYLLLLAALAGFVHHYVFMTDAFVQAILAE